MEPTILPSLVELTQKLIRIPSGNPPGEEERIARFAADWLGAAGVESQLVPLEPGRSSLVARVRGERPGSVVLCGHFDTVPTESDAWSVPPLEGQVVDERLWGLGAADMKGGVAVLMHVVAHLARSQVPPRYDVVLALTADEEVGYRGAATVAETGLIDDAKLLLIAEPSSGHVYTGQKGELWIEIVVHGHEAHGSTPGFGTNAILPAARLCARIEEEIAALPEIAGRGRTTLNVGRFDGGRRVNIVPDHAVAHFDVRITRPEDRDAVLARVDRIGEEEASRVGARFERRVLSDHAPIAGTSDMTDRLVQAIVKVSGKRPAIGISPFSTDAVSIVPRLDLPVLIYGPGEIARAHRQDESIALEELRVPYEVLRRFLART